MSEKISNAGKIKEVFGGEINTGLCPFTVTSSYPCQAQTIQCEECSREFWAADYKEPGEN